MNYEVDVAVVGAGPAGSIAARDFARKGFNVLVLEKRQEIGCPKRCAEGLNAEALERIGVKPDPRWAVQEIDGAVLYMPDMHQVKLENLGMRGYILERKVFEKHLAAAAIKEGARYMVKTNVTDVIKEEGVVVGVKAVHMGEEITVRARVVIAADGVDSLTAKRAGLNTRNHLKDYHSGFQYEMAGVKGVELNKLHIFFGNEVAPKGYVWIFPKGELANVGIGIVGTKSDDGNRAREYLNRFIDSHPEFFEEASPVEVNGGGIPVSISSETFVGDGLMVVGDAAQQVNPIHGGGISLAMDAAALAAEVGCKALEKEDVGRDMLIEYEERWHSGDGARMRKLAKVRAFLERMEDDDFNRMGRVIDGEVVMKIVEGDSKSLLEVVMKKAPKLLPIAKKFIG